MYRPIGLNEWEKGEISFQPKNISFISWWKFPLIAKVLLLTDVEKGGRALLEFFVFGEFVLVFEINYLKSSFINKFHPLCRLSNLQKLPINSIIAAVQILAQ